jgi:hypothetical protein
VEKVAKLCADFKSGIETIFVNHDNKQEYIEIDDFVRQGDYKYTYSDNNSTALKSEQADLVVGAVERFSQIIPLNLQEIFIWYFEQKGVDNPERFLGTEINGTNTNDGLTTGVDIEPLNPENPNINALLPIIGMLLKEQKGKGTKNEPNEFDDFIKSLEKICKENQTEER